MYHNSHMSRIGQIWILKKTAKKQKVVIFNLENEDRQLQNV